MAGPKHKPGMSMAGIAAHGSDGKGSGGVAGAVYQAVADNPRNAVSLLCAITPREVQQDIRRRDIQITTIADLDAQLRAMGLPPVDQLFPPMFAIDFKGDCRLDDVECHPSALV